MSAKAFSKDTSIENTDADLYATIDLAVDKLDRQVIRHRDRIQGHHHEPIKRQPDVLEPGLLPQ